MKWLEVIELRAVKIDQNSIRTRIVELLEEKNDITTIKIYTNVLIDTDLSIHVQHDTEKVDPTGSVFGRQVKEMFQKWGIVNHRLWTEQKR